MFHFGKAKKNEKKTYDAAECKPVIKCSICTGEQVAGFLNLRTGAFEDVMLIRNSQELKAFMDSYGIKEEMEKIY